MDVGTLFMYQKGIIHLLPLFVILVALGLVVFLVFTGKINLGSLKIPFLNKKPTVQLQQKYSNPFDIKTQYVNPFDEFKNPFTVSK